MDVRQIILATGKVLIGLAFLSATAVGIIAVVEGESATVAYSATGRPAMFLPIAYVSILVTGAIVAVIFLIKKFSRTRHDNVEK